MSLVDPIGIEPTASAMTWRDGAYPDRTRDLGRGSGDPADLREMGPGKVRTIAGGSGPLEDEVRTNGGRGGGSVELIGYAAGW